MLSLLDLPLELRCIIWKHVLDFNDPSNVQVKTNRHHLQIRRIKNLQLFFVNRSVSYEAREQFYNTNQLIHISCRRCVLLPEALESSGVRVLSCHHNPDKAIYNRHAYHISILPGQKHDCNRCGIRKHGFDLTIPLKDFTKVTLGFATQHAWKPKERPLDPVIVRIGVGGTAISSTQLNKLIESWTLASPIQCKRQTFSISSPGIAHKHAVDLVERQAFCPRLLSALKHYEKQSEVFAQEGDNFRQRYCLSMILTGVANAWEYKGKEFETMGDEAFWQQLQQTTLFAVTHLSHPKICEVSLRGPGGSPVPILDKLDDVDKGIFLLQRIYRYFFTNSLPEVRIDRKGEGLIAVGAALRTKNPKYAHVFWGEFCRLYTPEDPRWSVVRECINELKV